MKVRIVKQATGIVEGLALDRFRLGRVYDVTATLASYLIAEGLAVAEMRGDEDAHPATDRRKGKQR